MSKSLDIAIEEFNYNLAEEKIAKFPLKERDQSKLLVLKQGVIQERRFFELPLFFDNDSLLIYNDTKVVHARLFFQKETGSKIEIFCLEPHQPNDVQLAFAQKGFSQWKCFVGNNKKWKAGFLSKTLLIDNKEVELRAERLEQDDNAWIIGFSWPENYSFAEVLSVMGTVPLPPYIKRETIEEDNESYQTVYAKDEGSVAAPTAGLHFTKKTFQDLDKRGVKSCFVTLHVGAGTFKPVSTDSISDHIMHTEKICVAKEIIKNLIAYCDKKICCIGTTSVRTIESLYWFGVRIIESRKRQEQTPTTLDIKQWEPYQNEETTPTKEALEAVLDMMERENLTHLSGQTQIIIAPSYKYRIVKSIVTNFHQPQSTLLLLVSAMIGDRWKEVYNYAINNDFRFLSFGDACYFEQD